MSFRFDHPEYLWLLTLAAPIVVLGWRSLAAMDPLRRRTAIALRLLVLVVLVLMLAGLESVRVHRDATVVVVLDRSESVRRFHRPPGAAGEPGGDAGASWDRRWLQQALRNQGADNRVGVVTFDGRPTVRSLPALAPDLDDTAQREPAEGTNTAAAIRLAMALFPADSGKRLLLAWDGNDTTSPSRGAGAEGEVLAAAREARAAGIPIDVLPLEYQLDREVMVEGVYAPAEARRGQTAAVRVVLEATRPAEGLLHLKRDGVAAALEGGASGAPIRLGDWVRQQEAQTRPGPPRAGDPQGPAPPARHVCVKLFQVPLHERGVNRFEAIFEPAGAATRPAAPASSGDTIPGNNSAEAFTLVHGQGKVLFVDGVGGDSGRILPGALAEHGIELEVIAPEQLPSDIVTLLRYDAVVLQNVAATPVRAGGAYAPLETAAAVVGPGQNAMLARYVHDLGGGLVMIGGPDSFGAGGWTGSPVDRILPVDCQIPSQTILPSGALVIVLDRSGSMGSPVAGSRHTQQEVANEAAVQALSALYPQDLIGVVAFDESPQWVVGTVSGLADCANAPRIAAQIRSIHPGGGTNMYPALEQAAAALGRLGPEDAAIKHVIVLTDGQSQDGPWFQAMGRMARSGVTLSTVGVGDAVNSGLLQQLAKMGGGTYYPVQDPKRLPQIFIKEARSIRKNLLKEKPFSPVLVQTGSPAMAGIQAAPPLRGLVLTGAKPDPRVYMPMVGAEGEPVFAHWQVGLGRSAAFTSDATNRWAVDWLRQGGVYADFWPRVVRLVARPSTSKAFDLATHLSGDKLHIRLEASGGAAAAADLPGASAGAFANFLVVAGAVLDPQGQPLPVSLQQTGPGVYEGEVPAARTGNYVVSLIARPPQAGAGGAAGGGAAAAIFGGASRPRGPELRAFGSNRAALEQVALLTGGRLLDPREPAAADLFSRQSMLEARSLRPLWRTLLAALLVLFLLDVAARRIAWDLPALWAWALGRADAVLGLLRGREVQAEATLAALKRKAEEVDRRLGTAAAAPEAPSTDTRRKFEAHPAELAEDDFAAAVGAASAPSEAGPALPPGPAPSSVAPVVQTTSRLLDAKRRAQQRLDPNDPSRQT